MDREPLMKAEAESSSRTSSEHYEEMESTPQASGESQTSHTNTNQWIEQAQDWYRSRNTRSRPFLLGGAVTVFFLVIFGIFHAASGRMAYTLHRNSLGQSSGQPSTAVFTPFYQANIAAPGVFPVDVPEGAPVELEAYCNLTARPPLYDPSLKYSYILPRPRREHVRPSSDHIDINEFMRQTILDMYCAQQHLSEAQALKMLRRTVFNLQDAMSWSLASLEIGKPTVYMTTATSPNGKSGPLRSQYFRRHGRTIRSWMAQQAKAAENTGFQIVWIVAEDESDIDPLVTRTLRRSGVPFVYFAYGLTRAWGNAQKNAVLQVSYALSRPHPRGILGHGPVYGLDDDNKILPDLITHLTKVTRVGVFPIGNLGSSGWEKPILDNQGIVTNTDSPWQRKFSVDYGAYTFNTSLLGTLISGPSFWKHTGYGGEDQFVQQMAQSMRQLEPLCGKNKEQDCQFVWHNEDLTDMEKMTDEEEVAYVQEFGAKKLFSKLGFEGEVDVDNDGGETDPSRTGEGV